jgi:hypothetical protein
MDWVNNFIARLRALFRRDVVLDEIDEEMRAHIEMEAEANRGLGMTADEARLSAAKSFGNLGSIRDLAYEVKGGGVVETLWRDVRYSGRLLLKHPGFALIAVLTLGPRDRCEHRDLQHSQRGFCSGRSRTRIRPTFHGWRDAYGRQGRRGFVISKFCRLA